MHAKRSIVTLLAGASILAAAPHEADAASRYRGDVAGVATGPGRSFPVGAGTVLRFRDREAAGTAYRVCWGKRGSSKRRCDRRTTKAAGKVSEVLFAPQQTGRYTATWRVGGAVVATWRWTQTLGD